VNRKGLLTLAVLCGGVFSAAGSVRAADPLADQLLRQWREGCRPLSRCAVTYRVRQLNHVFSSEKVADAVFYRDGRDRWAAHIGDLDVVGTASALQPANGRKPPTVHWEPLLAVCTPEGFALCTDGRCEGYLWKPVSALEPVNVQALSLFLRSFQDWLASHLALHALMPLFLPESGDFRSHRAAAERKPTGDLWLTLTPESGTFSAASHSRVDAVFRSGNLPYAIRVVDPSGSIATHYLIAEVRPRRPEEMAVRCLFGPYAEELQHVFAPAPQSKARP
jgi:hypothetical protein